MITATKVIQNRKILPCKEQINGIVRFDKLSRPVKHKTARLSQEGRD
nr:MAG TPA: hypothetical protein [Caudoviricetes sp.]